MRGFMTGFLLMISGLACLIGGVLMLMAGWDTFSLVASVGDGTLARGFGAIVGESRMSNGALLIAAALL